MKEQKKKVFTWRINLFIFIVFALGCMFGIAIHGITIPSLEGYLMSRARTLETNSYVNIYQDATSGNATSCNATSANATSGNATSTNATSGNATSNDARNDFIILTQLTMDNSTVKPGQRIGLQCYTYGNCLRSATLSFYNENMRIGFSVQVQYEGDGAYIIIPDDIVPGVYKLDNVLLIADSYGDGTFSRKYIAKENDLDVSVTIEKDETIKDIELKNIKFESDEVIIGENLGVTIETDSELNSARFTLRNKDTNELVVSYMKKENQKDCISFPSNTKEGTYELVSVSLSNGNTTTIYSKEVSSGAKEYNFNNIVKVKKGDLELLDYNNEDVTEEVIKEITTSKLVKKVIINADTKSIISEDVFNAIKGRHIQLIINYKGNQYEFNGNEIEIAKDIDVSIKSYLLSKENDIKEIVEKDGIILSFMSNGNLPCKATMRIKQTLEMKKVLGTNSIYVYYFDENTFKFEEIARNVNLDSQNYYQFSLAHNSKFLLTNEELNESLIQKNDEEVVSFLMSSKVYLLLIIFAVLVIVIAIVVIVVYNKNKTNNKNELSKNADDKKIEKIVENSNLNKENENIEKE